MDAAVRNALDIDASTPSRLRTVDITTTGARTGEPRRIEIWYHRVDGRWWITGTPGHPRAWLANLEADPSLVLHLKQDVAADLPATARVVRDPAERREVLTGLIAGMPDGIGVRMDLDEMVGSAPLIELLIHDLD